MLVVSVFASAISLALGVCAVATGSVGSPIGYFVALAISIAWLVRVLVRIRVRIAIVRDATGLRVQIQGPTLALDERLRPGCDYWLRYVPSSPRTTDPQLCVAITTVQGQRLGFRHQCFHAPEGWRRSSARLDDVAHLFICRATERLPTVLG